MQIRYLNLTPAVQLPHESTLQQVIAIMTQAETECVVLTHSQEGKQSQPVGIVTERDLVILLLNHGTDLSIGITNATTNSHLITIHEKDSSRRAIKLMSQHGVHKLPVLREDGSLKGILTVDNLLHHLANSNQRLISPVVESMM